MRDPDCVELLRWAAPRLGLRWEGFRRVRRQVCKRIGRRIAELGLEGIGGYRQHLEAHPEEAAILDALCRVAISRFYRDRGVFDALGGRVLPALAAGVKERGASVVRLWSAGCAGGEEPYTLALIWHFVVRPRAPTLAIQIVASDAHVPSLERARRACYAASSLKELPAAWREEGFVRREGLFCLRDELRRGVELRCEDLRRDMPEGPFDLILCRNTAFTYFAEAAQRRMAERLVERLVPGGALVIGAHERLAEGAVPLAVDPEVPCIHWKGTASGQA
jgi:chemotaxis protein methyltransferase CheR